MARRVLRIALVHLILILAVLLVGFPLIFALIKATQTGSAVNSANLIPSTHLWDNLLSAWNGAKLGLYIRNSFVVAVGITVLKVVTSALAAMALVYFRIPAKGLLFTLILLTLMLPSDLLVVALFDLVNKLGWANTYQAIILPFAASATGIFLLRQHFMNVPPSLLDAARIDGAGPFRFLFAVLIPLSWNTIGALTLIQFIYGWEQYLWPLIIIRDSSHQVIQVGLKSLIGQASGQTDWGMVMAGTLVAILPPIVMFTLLGRQFSRGFILSESK
ncbi:carbohydrate ABC transporter permease [Meiothermus granaticius]|uniref:Lactose transport system permease protein LacG n=1 Tax=Meiothermus granaticius NBRC 107808 TaxID=1227551 RepID=A0A399FA19_9DEIN|nr:ABC transporter permease subunit [Meiothermus granaticius]MCL6525722.1 ABC transporter permease subunit [Thermaceae bacterium]RIH93078.1 Lactose transport system permease protein LacG [Meiothermus granaticius NBRC 107808]GEM86647.1 sn-glycerol-3-phosphate transport system permease protein UgpE [Meiothermus granaticius NBRC 107808]